MSDSGGDAFSSDETQSQDEAGAALAEGSHNGTPCPYSEPSLAGVAGHASDDKRAPVSDAEEVSLGSLSSMLQQAAAITARREEEHSHVWEKATRRHQEYLEEARESEAASSRAHPRRASEPILSRSSSPLYVGTQAGEFGKDSVTLSQFLGVPEPPPRRRASAGNVLHQPMMAGGPGGAIPSVQYRGSRGRKLNWVKNLGSVRDHRLVRRTPRRDAPLAPMPVSDSEEEEEAAAAVVVPEVRALVTEGGEIRSSQLFSHPEWFHGRLTRQEGETRLRQWMAEEQQPQGQAESMMLRGAFLIRAKADGETYALTVCDGQVVRHILVLRAIRKSGKRGRHFVINNTHLPSATTIQQVVDMLSSGSGRAGLSQLSSIPLLRHPCPVLN